MKKEEKEPEIDESLLTEEQLEEIHKKRNYKGWIIFFGVMLALIIACMIVILTIK